MGEIISTAIGTIIDFFLVGKIDRGLRRYRWLQFAGLALFAVAFGLVAGSVLGALI